MALRLMFLLVVISYTPNLVHSQHAWWGLGVTSCASAGTCNCAQLETDNMLDSSQSEKCGNDPSSVAAIARGTRQSIIECQKVFRSSRWNCSTFDGANLFGSFVTTKRTRETAVLNALLTAGATHSTAEACRNQKIQTCPCILPDLPPKDDEGNNILVGCSDNVEWALDYVLDFVEPSSTVEVGPLSDAHNIEVGGMLVNSLEKICKCHGLSGSCSAQTCYEKVPDISEIGEQLFLKYGGAVQVQLTGEDLVGANPNNISDPLRNTDLAYVDQSPNFCEADPEKGVLGTVNRKCDISPNSVDSCSVLCCGRGHYSRTYTVPVEECRFVYCCKIVCETVRTDTITDYFCNP